MDEDVEAGAALIEEMRGGETPPTDDERQPAAPAPLPDGGSDEKGSEGPKDDAPPEDDDDAGEKPDAEADEGDKATGDDEKPEHQKESTHRRMKRKLVEARKALDEHQARDGEWAALTNDLYVDNVAMRDRIEALEQQLGDNGITPAVSRELQELRAENARLKSQGELSERRAKDRADAVKREATEAQAARVLDEADRIAAGLGLDSVKIIERAMKLGVSLEEAAAELAKLTGAATKKQIAISRTAPRTVTGGARPAPKDYPPTVEGATEFLLARRGAA